MSKQSRDGTVVDPSGITEIRLCEPGNMFG
jgi:hypothetical protein